MQPSKIITQGDVGNSVTAVITDSDENPIDLSSAVDVAFVMRALGDTEDFNGAGETVIVGDPTNGRVRYTFAAGETDTAGEYYFQYVVTWPEGDVSYPTQGPLLLRIIPNLVDDDEDPIITLTFASVADYRETFPGSDIDINVLYLAELVVGATANIATEAHSSLTDNDAYWLRLATCMQARWLSENPDYLSMHDLRTVSQVGVSSQPTPEGLIISPLARMALKNLSWVGSRSLSIKRQEYGYAPLRDIPENSRAWKPLQVPGWRY
jgi:hypothetical protein